MSAQTLESWDDLRYFLAVARSGTLSGAARDLGVNHSTVFRRIGALEEHIGSRLFERLPRGYALTAAGEDMVDHAERIEDEMNALGRKLLGRDQEMHGEVRVTTVEEILKLIAPHLRCFHDAHPGITLVLDTDQRLLSLGRREADVAIRPGARADEPDVAGRRICGLHANVYAARSYLDSRGEPENPDDLDGHDLITFGRPTKRTAIYQWLTTHAPNSRVVFESHSMLGTFEAAKAGLGIAVLPSFMSDVEPSLVRLFETSMDQSSHGLWLLVHKDLRQTARVRAFVDFVTKALENEADLFEGRRPAG